MRTANKHGRVGVKRRRPTTNQALRQQNNELAHELMRQAQVSVPVQRAAPIWLALVEVEQMTSRSKTGVARKVHDYVSEFLQSHA